MNLGVLAHVERGEMETEGANPPQHAPHIEKAGGLAAVFDQAASDDFEVFDQLLDSLVLAGRMVVRGTQARRNLRQQHAIRHAIVARRR